jgi:DNA-binding IclR family transcriptional regulator
MAGNSAEAGRTVTSKAAAILMVFTTGGTHTLSTIAGQTGIAVSTAHRLLTDLVGSGLLERTGCGQYRPGSGLRTLAHGPTVPALRQRGPLVVDDLSAALGMPARLGVLDQLEVAYIEKRPGPFPGTSFPNRARLPAHASAMGKALLAHAPRSLVQVVLANGLTCHPPWTPQRGEQLLRALQTCRARGIAVADRELDPHAFAVAVPMLDAVGGAIAALEVQVPRLAEQALAHVVPALTMAVRGLRRELAPSGRPVRRVLDLSTAL